MSLVKQFSAIDSNRSAEVTRFVRPYAEERVYACGVKHRQPAQSEEPARPIVVLKNHRGSANLLSRALRRAIIILTGRGCRKAGMQGAEGVVAALPLSLRHGLIRSRSSNRLAWVRANEERLHVVGASLEPVLLGLQPDQGSGAASGLSAESVKKTDRRSLGTGCVFWSFPSSGTSTQR